MKKNKITINARKYDGKIHRTWKAQFIEQRDSLLVFVGLFEKEVIHPDLGVIRRGTISYEYYWLDRWYNIFCFHEPTGEFRNFYCNINQPPTFKDNVLDYIDLDLDILVWQDLSYKILDEDEFKANSIRFNYSRKLIEKVFANLHELELLIKTRKFPFALKGNN